MSPTFMSKKSACLRVWVLKGKRGDALIYHCPNQSRPGLGTSGRAWHEGTTIPRAWPRPTFVLISWPAMPSSETLANPVRLKLSKWVRVPSFWNPTSEILEQPDLRDSVCSLWWLGGEEVTMKRAGSSTRQSVGGRSAERSRSAECCPWGPHFQPRFPSRPTWAGMRGGRACPSR